MLFKSTTTTAACSYNLSNSYLISRPRIIRLDKIFTPIIEVHEPQPRGLRDFLESDKAGTVMTSQYIHDEGAISSQDDQQLLAMGHKPQLHRKFSFLSMLGLAFAVLNSWTALAASISLALPSGGSSAVVWGLFVAGVCNLCLSVSLSEFLSAFPTAGGQYHWVALVSPPKYRRIFSWITGWISVGGWIALSAAAGLLSSELIMGMIALYHPLFEAKRWQQFLIYIGYALWSFLMNAFGTKVLPFANKISFFWSIFGFVAICITVLVTKSPSFAEAKWVFGNFFNETGWPNGIAWLMGLLQGSFGLTAYDAVAHMIEEIPNPSVQGPRIMNSSIIVGVLTGLVFLIVLMFVSGGQTHLKNIISSPQTPLICIFKTATDSNAAAICLTMFPLVCLVFAALGSSTTSSRMTFAFAREHGLPASYYLALVHPTLKMPFNALLLTTTLIVIFGLVFLGSSSAFNAITSAATIALNLSYGIPIAINCCQGRKHLPERTYRLGPVLGWAVNLIGIAYVVLTTVLFFFPPVVPATGTSMNYAIVVFFLWLTICIIYWFTNGRKSYQGPILGHETDHMVPVVSDLSKTVSAKEEC